MGLGILLLAVLVPGQASFKDARKELDRALDSGDEAKIVEATKALLGTEEAKAVPLVVKKALFHDSLTVREAALEGLRGISSEKGIETLAREATGKKADHTVVLLRALQGHKGKGVWRAARSGIKAKDWRVRIAGARVAAQLGEEADQRDLERALKDSHPRVVHEVAKAVKAVGGGWPDSVPFPEEGDLFPSHIPSDGLVVLVDASDLLRAPVEAEGAKTALEDVARRVLPVLEAIPQRSRINVIAYSSRIRKCFKEMEKPRGGVPDDLDAFLKRLRPEYGADLWEGMKRALEEEDVDTIYIVASAPPSAGAVTDPGRIREKMREINFTRSVAVHTILVPLPGSGEVRSFLQALADENDGTFREARISIRKEKEEEEEKKPETEGFPIRKVNGRIPEEEWIRVEAVFDEALGWAGGERAVRIVEAVAGADDPRAADLVLRKALFHEDLSLAEAAGRGLGRCEDGETTGIIVKAARTERNPGRRVVLCRLLGEIDGEESDDVVLRLLHKGVPWPIRSAAIDVTRRRIVPGARDVLLGVLDEGTLRLGAEAAESLRAMGETVEAYPPSSRLYGDRLAFVLDVGESLGLARQAILEDLGRLDPGSRFWLFTLAGVWKDDPRAPSEETIGEVRTYLETLVPGSVGGDPGALIRSILEGGESDTITLLTDGAISRVDIRSLNRTRNVRIHTVLVHPEPAGDLVEVIRGIAEDSRGSFRQIP